MDTPESCRVDRSAFQIAKLGEKLSDREYWLSKTPQACYEKRQTMEISGLAVPVIHLDDLKRNKRAAGRMKDLADMEEL